MVKKENKTMFKASWSYDKALESTDHIQINKNYELYIDGKFRKPSLGKYFDTINPSNHQKIAKIAEATSKDVDMAVKAARRAFKSWSELTGKDRGKYIFRIARLIQERAKEFAVIESLDGGKPIRESRDIDIPLAANHFFYYAGWADKLSYAFPNRDPKPLGVVGQIIPWNFPLLMAAWKIAPALATGNTVVLKPAETTPLTALKFAEIIHES
jgi:aldehyde dehydrogenase (NAD+)